MGRWGAHREYALGGISQLSLSDRNSELSRATRTPARSVTRCNGPEYADAGVRDEPTTVYTGGSDRDRAINAELVSFHTLDTLPDGRRLHDCQRGLSPPRRGGRDR